MKSFSIDIDEFKNWLESLPRNRMFKCADVEFCPITSYVKSTNNNVDFEIYSGNTAFFNQQFYSVPIWTNQFIELFDSNYQLDKPNELSVKVALKCLEMVKI